MKLKQLFRRAEAVFLAFITTVCVFPTVSTVATVYAVGNDAFKPITYRFAAETSQQFVIPAAGWYTIDLYGAVGGSTRMVSGAASNGGAGGHVKAKYYFEANEVLYVNVGGAGHNAVSSSAYLPLAGGYNGGGSACTVGFASGGGSTDVRLGNNDVGSRIAVAAGGGGSSVHRNGNPGGGSGSGNNGTAYYGSNAAANYSGGGGGYMGGAPGSSSSNAQGGSNFVNTSTHSGSVLLNEAGTSSYGQCIITRESNYSVTLQLNGGSINGNTNDVLYSYSGSSIEKAFAYTGSTQAYTIPEDGYYEVTVVGASGGGSQSGGSRGGKGGYSQGTIYLTKGTVVYVNVGGMGQEGSNVAGGWNGGGQASSYSTGSSGGGATDVCLSWSGAATVWNNNNHLHSRFIVAGGGGGSDNTELGSAGTGDDGSGGEGGGDSGGYGWSNGARSSGCAPGTQTSGYAFGYGGRAYDVDADAGSGGGGWYGGYPAGNAVARGSMEYNNAGGGGGSGYIYTAGTAGYYPSPVALNSSHYMVQESKQTGYNYGNGYASIRLKGLLQYLPTPVRDGYRFTGWTVVSGAGTLVSNNCFSYANGNTVIKANWAKVEGYATLHVDPNGGEYSGKTDAVTYSKHAGDIVNVNAPVKYGYVFTGWTYTRNKAAARDPQDSWDSGKSRYTFGYESEATLKANWKIAKTTLTVDPNGGTYNGSTKTTTYADKAFGTIQKIENPTLKGYNFVGWDETSGSDGYLDDKDWHFGTKDAVLKAKWEPITYTVHYEPNQPEGLTVSGKQPDQTHVYDQNKDLAMNAEYDDPTGYKIPNVKFLWWNTKPDGSGTTYKSGQSVKNLTSTQGDIITLYAQWMVKYTVQHYTQELDGSYTLADTDTYWLIPLTEWTPDLHTYDGFYQPEVQAQTVNVHDMTIDLYYDLIHYPLSYDLQGGEWYEEQSDGTWIEVAAPPSEYTVLTPDIHVTRPDKVGYDFTGWTGTDVNSKTLDVVIPKGSLGARSFTAHWQAQAYDIDIPMSLILSVGYEGTANGMFDQNGDGQISEYGYITNNSKFPVQVTDVNLEGNDSFEFTNDRTLDETHPNIMDFRLDAQNGSEWNAYASELTDGDDTSKNEVFWMAQNGNGQIQFNTENEWALHDAYDIKTPKQVGKIVWTFGIGHRVVSSRALAR